MKVVAPTPPLDPDPAAMAAEADVAGAAEGASSRDDRGSAFAAAVSRIARASLNVAGLVVQTLLAVLGLDDLPLALGGSAALGSAASRLSDAAGLASVENWLLEVRRTWHVAFFSGTLLWH